MCPLKYLVDFLNHSRERASVGNVKVLKHKSNLPSTNTPVNVLLGEPVNSSDIKLVSSLQNNHVFLQSVLIVLPIKRAVVRGRMRITYHHVSEFLNISSVT